MLACICVGDWTSPNVPPAGVPTFKDVVEEDVKVQVNPPHNYKDVEPDTLSYHMLTTEEAELPT